MSDMQSNCFFCFGYIHMASLLTKFYMPHPGLLPVTDINKPLKCLLSYIQLFLIIYQLLLPNRTCHHMGKWETYQSNFYLAS